MTALSSAQRLALLMAPHLLHGDSVFVGANQQFVQRAVALAEADGRRIRMVAAGGWWLENPNRADGLGTYSPEAIEGYDVPMHQERAFEDLRRIPFLFIGGLQLDRFGNANLIGVGAEGTRWKLHGPGSTGVPTLSGASSVHYAYSLTHDHRSLVDRVEYVSALGDPRRREELGLPQIVRGGVFTPLGRFDWRDGELRLVELGLDVTVAEVRERTGFAVQVADDLQQQPQPDAAQLAAVCR